MTVALETTQLLGFWLGSLSTLLNDSEPGCAGEHWHHRCLVFAFLVVTVGLVFVACLDPGSVSLAIIILGQVGIRKVYRLDVNVDPKINAFLILEKARTGKTVAEIVEAVFREYQRRRSGATDDEGRKGREPGS